MFAHALLTLAHALLTLAHALLTLFDVPIRSVVFPTGRRMYLMGRRMYLTGRAHACSRLLTLAHALLTLAHALLTLVSMIRSQSAVKKKIPLSWCIHTFMEHVFLQYGCNEKFHESGNAHAPSSCFWKTHMMRKILPRIYAQ